LNAWIESTPPICILRAVKDAENSPLNEVPEKLPIHPRVANHQMHERPPAQNPDFEGLITQLTRVLEDFRPDKAASNDTNSNADVPRIRQSGQVPLPPSGDGLKRKRKRRRSKDGNSISVTTNELPGSRRRRERRRKFLILISAVFLAFAASNYATARFFYRSGVSEGMRKGLEAQAAVVEKNARPFFADTLPAPIKKNPSQTPMAPRHSQTPNP
jgi:hypothetical protein